MTRAARITVELQDKIEKLPTVASTDPPLYRALLHPDGGEQRQLISEIKDVVPNIISYERRVRDELANR